MTTGNGTERAGTRGRFAEAAETIRESGGLWRLLRDYLGLGRRREPPIADRDALRRFIETRASLVAQTTLYGYLRTRAGVRYPELFDDDVFVVSINHAKWQMWLACLADLSVYAGGLLARAAPAAMPRVAALMEGLVGEVLDEAGRPADAGPDFERTAAAVRRRIAACDWLAVGDDDGAFTDSPPALVRYAPIVDALKELDEPIVLNSVRFRWNEVRRDLRRDLRPEAVLAP